MNWIGKWQNEYGSVLDITLQENGKLEGTFESAIDETTKGMKLPVVGVYNDNLIAVACAGGDHVVTYTGMFYEEKLKTTWHVVSSTVVTAKAEGEKAERKQLDWWQAVKTNVDTFEKLD